MCKNGRSAGFASKTLCRFRTSNQALSNDFHRDASVKRRVCRPEACAQAPASETAPQAVAVLQKPRQDHRYKTCAFPKTLTRAAVVTVAALRALLEHVPARHSGCTRLFEQNR